MACLRDYKSSKKFRKIFILDRNDGKCYTAKNKKEKNRFFMIFGDRFVEMAKQKGDWGFFILEVIPGSKKRRIF